MIEIHQSKTADTRTCDFAKVSKETLLESSEQHIGDVWHALAFFRSKLLDAAETHDPGLVMETGMRSLSKKQEEERQKIIGDLQEAAEKVEASIAAFNASQESAFAEVEKAKDEYNQKVVAADEFRYEIYSAQSDYFNDKSENWQEGDAGSAYSEWKDAWEESFDALEIEPPQELEAIDDDMNHSDRLSDLASERRRLHEARAG